MQELHVKSLLPVRLDKYLMEQFPALGLGRLNKALREIAADKTVVFISHRLSTTRDADCIYMMEDGRIVEQGTHNQLLAANGKYAQMWNAQAGRYC